MGNLSLLDLGFFIAESEASPKHVAGLLIFKPPPKAAPGFAAKLYREFLSFTDVEPPFNRVISFSLGAMPGWREAESTDLAQHVFLHKLARGHNRRADLYRLVSELHGPLLDRSRPLWELHVIEGLWDGQFALYQKMHHAYADGVTMARWTAQGLSESAADRSLRPVWTSDRSGRRRREAQGFGKQAMQDLLLRLTGAGKQAIGIGRLSTMLFLESVKLTKNAIALPYLGTPHTPLTGQVTPGRQFATTTIAMERVQRVRSITRSTLNHVALTCLDGALHRYLHEQGVRLDRPIMIQMPVNLRAAGDQSSGNKIGIIMVELSPPCDDPYVRLRNIGFSLRNVRTMVDGVAPSAIETYTIVTGLIAQIAETLKLSGKLPPMGNTLVSNVPGPKDYLYLKGARMEEMHPISTLPPSNLLNITLFSYAGQLTFGLIATDALPALGRLAEHISQAFAELEQAVGAAAVPTKPTPRKTKKETAA